jgi:tetratricopeptide (TPR) repeat protein
MKITTLFLGFIIVSNFLFSQNSDNLTKAFASSYDYENKVDYPKAIEEMISVYDASSYEINLRLGWLYYINADYVKSQTYYKKCMALQPNSIEAMLGYVYPTSAIENWDDVLKTYLQILKIDPRNTLVNYRVGLIYYYRSEFSIALTYIKKVLELYPFDYDSNVLAAKIYVSLGEIANAKKHYNIALHFAPTSKEIIDALSKL